MTPDTTDPVVPAGVTVQTYRLLRTGDQPLAFEGVLLADASGPRINGTERNRGHDIRIYRTRGGTHVIELVYWTTWKGEAEIRRVQVLGREVRQIPAALKLYDPILPVHGYPAAERFAARQARLFAEIRADYETRVSDVLTQVPDVVERIE